MRAGAKLVMRKHFLSFALLYPKSPESFVHARAKFYYNYAGFHLKDLVYPNGFYIKSQ